MMSDTNFTYEAFDRQVTNLLTMTQTLIDGWDDYGSMEMNLDLKSLTIKAAKVCYMADEDHARQVDKLVQERTEANRRLFTMVNDFMEQELSPFVRKVSGKMQRGDGMRGETHGMFTHSISAILPRIAELLDSPNSRSAADIVNDTAMLEKLMSKKKTAMMHGMTDIERFWTLYELYTLMSYLLLHFQTMHKMTHREISPDEIGRLLLMAIQQYAQTDEGNATLTRHLEALRFDHGGQLTPEVLQTARIALREEVPESLQMCFMQHINDLDALGRNLLNIKGKSTEDIRTFIVVVAKWLMLTEELEELIQPRDKVSDLPNEVFHDRLFDKHVSMEDLRRRIERMLSFINRKNHWFCLWSVLRYHNVLKDLNTEAFARQMLSPEWFGKRPGIITFTGDTLREYSGYFTDRTFRVWDDATYLLYCDTHNKKKWSPTLCHRFLQICHNMDDAFMEG